MGDGRLAAATITSRNYLPYARVLCESWLEHHPESPVTVVLLDHDGTDLGWAPAGVRCCPPGDIGVADDELAPMAAMYGPAELAIALKPWALRHLLAEADAAVYLDGDIEVMAPMPELIGLAGGAGVVITPHTVHPLPDDGRGPGPSTILQAGVYNAGFVAVGPGGRDFLDWWGVQLRRHCIHDPAAGFHGDQRWLDLVPSYFDHLVLRDPTYNVAYWNLHERPLRWDGRRLSVEGAGPVRFFHFSGLSPDEPWTLSRYAGPEARVVLREHPVVGRASRRYLERLEAAGLAHDRTLPYRFATTAAGTTIDTRARRVFRAAQLAADDGSADPPPSPFDASGAFEAWLRAPDDGRTTGRYLRRAWEESAYLQALFADVDGADHERFLRWAHLHGERTASLVPDLLPDEAPPAPAPTTTSEPPEAAVHDDPTQRPLPQLTEAADLLARRARPQGAEASGGPVANRARAVADALLSERDRRQDRLALALAEAVSELRDRIAMLGETVHQALGDDLRSHAVRLSLLEEALARTDEAGDELGLKLDRRLDDLGEALLDLSRRIDGALDQHAITAGIVADAEARLTAELEALRRRLDEA